MDEQHSIVSGSKNYLKAKFYFSSEWSGKHKTAVFSTVDKEKVYQVMLENNMCMVPWEVITDEGFTVSVFAGNLLNTNEVTVHTKENGLIPGIVPPEPTPDLYDQMRQEFHDTINEANIVLDKIKDQASHVAANINDHKLAEDLDHPEESVQTRHLARQAVTTDKLDLYAVNATKIASGAVDTSKIKNAAVTVQKLAGQSVTEEKLGTELAHKIERFMDIGTLTVGNTTIFYPQSTFIRKLRAGDIIRFQVDAAPVVREPYTLAVSYADETEARYAFKHFISGDCKPEYTYIAIVSREAGVYNSAKPETIGNITVLSCGEKPPQINGEQLQDSSVAERKLPQVTQLKLNNALQKGQTTGDLNIVSQTGVYAASTTTSIASHFPNNEKEGTIFVVPSSPQITQIFVTNNGKMYSRSGLFNGVASDCGQWKTIGSIENSSVTDSKIGTRQINNPDENTGTSAGLLTALLNKITNAIRAHRNNTQNPHQVTKAQIGLEHVDNTADADKPVSSAMREAIDNKANITKNRYDTKGDSIITHFTVGGRELDSTFGPASCTTGSVHCASAQSTFIGGGFANKTLCPGSAIVGGTQNKVGIIGSSEGEQSGDMACIIGGAQNTVCGVYSVIVGGEQNTLEKKAVGSTVLGGNMNRIIGEFGAIIGGYNNTAEGRSCVVMGGRGNSGKAYNTVIGHYNLPPTAGTETGTEGDALIVGSGTSTAASNCFRVDYAGNGYFKTAVNSTGADYAELWEWQDGNAEQEDRAGYFAAMQGDKIRLAEDGDDLRRVGVISANPAVCGDNYADEWQGKYLRDIYGRYQTEHKQYPAVTDDAGMVIREAYEADERIINPAYNPEKTYIPRTERKEYDFLGTHGKLVVRDDGTCAADGFCRPGNGGKATASDDGFYVMERIDEEHIRIYIR